jgi:hypothetical protein
MGKYEGHTPGPWSIVKNDLRTFIYGPDGISVAQAIGPTYTKEANAKLIADAPKLAERVEELERNFRITIERFEALHEREKKLAEQNERMLAMLRLLHDTNTRRSYEMQGQLRALIAEIEEG